MGSELPYDGLPAMSLDGQPLAQAAATATHLACPAIPRVEGLPAELCVAAGLCLARAELEAGGHAYRRLADTGRFFWRIMPDALPASCRLPLSMTCRWRRRIHCKHRGRRLCLGEPPWQPKTANTAAAAPGAIACSCRAAPSSVRPEPAAASLPVACAATVSCGAMSSSSTCTRERASHKAARRDVLAAHARACRPSPWGGDPCGGTGAVVIVTS